MSSNSNITNPKDPSYWDERYSSNQINWDINKATPIFVDWFNKVKGRKKILIPGAGRGHDAFFLADKGHDVYAVDFSLEPINWMKKKANSNNIKLNIIHDNILDMKNYYGDFDIVLEYTFFCAILPSQRLKYIEALSKFLKDGGSFVGILFPLNKNIKEGGPPFGVNFSEVLNMFSKYFNLIDSYKSKLSIKPRLENEIFVHMRKCIK